MNDQSKSAEPKDPRIEAALREYLERVDRGEPLDREEFLARHAPIAEQLRSFIAAEEDVRKLAAGGAETPHDQARDSTKSFVGQGQETLVPQLMAKRNVVRGLEGRFGRYRIIRALGKGAMGTVYLAEDTQIERQVALKTPHFTEDPTGEQMERFFREARAAGNLRHPHICPIYDFGQIDGRHFITMAYIEGRPLSAFIQPDCQQAERQILLLVRKLALALQEAHDHGVVHRDLKPANIMVDKKGEPIIMDFGLAQQTRRNEDVRLTLTGNILGTPAFMSPEQVEGEPEKIGPPADQYGLGVILYELLTGELPFRGSIAAVMGQILTKQPTPPSQLRPDLDARIEVVCLKMMAKNPAERFRSLKAVADEISSILKSPAAKTTSKEQSAPSPAPLPAGDRARADAGASQVLKSLRQKTLSEKDLESLEELARKCYSRHDFEQVIQIIERVPEKRRNAALQALLEKSRGKADEISFLICDIDEAERLNDRRNALKKADELLKIKPGHHRALKVQEQFAGYGKGGAARLGPLQQFTRPWSEGGWIPWSVLAFGVAVIGVMTGVIVINWGKAAIVIDVRDPNIVVAVKGTDITITGPKQEKVKVWPGDQELIVSYAGLETKTKSFTIKKGERKVVTVSIVNSEIVARLEGEIAPLTLDHEKTTAAIPPPTLNSAATLSPTFKNSLGMEFVRVPKGKSWLGGSNGKPGDKEVVIARDFYLGKYEVTQDEWEKVTGLTPSSFSRTGGGKDKVRDIADAELKRFPVENVSWNDAQAFLERLNKREQEAGWIYRLPNGAEWEYACRGGPLSDKSESAYNFYVDEPTNQLLPEQANFGRGRPDRALRQGPLMRTCKVGSYKPNRLGLYDMHGNVFEWCDDTETGAAGASLLVYRGGGGGGWEYGSDGCAAADRRTNPPSKRDWRYGLRVARIRVGLEVVKNPAKESKPTDVPPGPPADVATTTPKSFGRPFLVRGDWRIENDELVETALAGGEESCPLLVFGEPTLSNYDLTLEAKKTVGPGDLGIYFHWLGPGHDREFYLAANKWINFSYSYKGIYGREEGNGKELSHSSNQWYLLKIEARGDTFRGYLDDVLQFEQTDARFTRGRICLYTWDAAARFRRIKVSDPQGKVLLEGLPELPHASINTTPNANLDNNREGNFFPLFNGKDLTGWNVYPEGTGNWKVEDGLLIGSGPLSHLFSKRGDYRNFRFRVEAQINDHGNSGQYFRTQFGPGFPKGYEAQIDSTHRDPIRTGSLYGFKETEVREMLVPPGEWFTQEVTAIGNHIVIKVNGKKTVDYRVTDPNKSYSQGHFALQQHDPGTVVKFRKIEVLELPPASHQTNAKADSATEQPNAPQLLVAPFDEATAKNGQEASTWAGQDLVLDLGGGVKMRLVRIKAGSFLMGSPDSDHRAVANEKPQHEVRITHDFLVGKYVVTRDDFARFVEEEGYKTDAEQQGQGEYGYNTAKNTMERSAQYTWRDPGFGQTGRHPVVNVTWNDAQAFCRWLSKKTGRRCELPTEAQWEYACRAGTTTRYFTGNDPNSLRRYANVRDATLKDKGIKGSPNWPFVFSFSDGFAFTSPVEVMKPNPWGLHDMTGNVLQWCSDWHDDRYYANALNEDPQGPTNGSARVLRGGSWFSGGRGNCRVAYRYEFGPLYRNLDIGFRVLVRLD